MSTRLPLLEAVGERRASAMLPPAVPVGPPPGLPAAVISARASLSCVPLPTMSSQAAPQTPCDSCRARIAPAVSPAIGLTLKNKGEAKPSLVLV